MGMRAFLLGCLCLLFSLLAGCAGKSLPVQPEVVPEARVLPEPASLAPPVEAAVPDREGGAPAQPPPAAPAPFRPGRGSAECYPAGGAAVRPAGGRCEPQSLPFARCRSGIMSCRLGVENGPLTWFACEERRGNTSLLPRPGSVLILAANARRKMPTGHVAYVEEARQEGPLRYRLVFSHTNFDRRCSLETGVAATYDSGSRTIDIESGAWRAWGKKLPVAGFILP